jgi:hypothetical protein
LLPRPTSAFPPRLASACLLNFDPVPTPEMCCHRSKIIAIAEIATLFSLGGVAGACVDIAWDNAFLRNVAKCVLDLQPLGVAT